MMGKLTKKQVENVLKDWYNYLMDENEGILREEEIYLYTEKYYNEESEDINSGTDEGQLTIPDIIDTVCEHNNKTEENLLVKVCYDCGKPLERNNKKLKLV